MKLIVAVLVLAVAAAAGDQFVQVYCGRRLAQTLGALCSSNYLAKRSGLELVALEEWDAGWGPARARALRGARGKRQVVSECCDKACALSELLTYC